MESKNLFGVTHADNIPKIEHLGNPFGSRKHRQVVPRHAQNWLSEWGEMFTILVAIFLLLGLEINDMFRDYGF